MDVVEWFSVHGGPEKRSLMEEGMTGAEAGGCAHKTDDSTQKHKLPNTLTKLTFTIKARNSSVCAPCLRLKSLDGSSLLSDSLF